MTEIDWQAWHELMESYGWRPVRDVFGAVVQYTLPRLGIGKPLVLNAGDFAQYAGLMQTPPPF